MIMSGAKEAQLLEVRFLDVHGTIYCDLVYAHAGDQQPRQARIGKEDVYADPQPGDLVKVRYVMNVVTGVERGGG